MTDAIKGALDSGKARLREIQTNLELIHGKRKTRIIMVTAEAMCTSHAMSVLHKRLGALQPVGDLMLNELGLAHVELGLLASFPDWVDVESSDMEAPTVNAFKADILTVSKAYADLQLGVGRVLKGLS